MALRRFPFPAVCTPPGSHRFLQKCRAITPVLANCFRSLLWPRQRALRHNTVNLFCYNQISKSVTQCQF